jgi:hypothetical protein
MNICNPKQHFRVWLFAVALFAIPSTGVSAGAAATLKDAFKEHFLIGAAVNRSMVTGGAAFRQSTEQNVKDIALLKEQCCWGERRVHARLSQLSRHQPTNRRRLVRSGLSQQQRLYE